MKEDHPLEIVRKAFEFKYETRYGDGASCRFVEVFVISSLSQSQEQKITVEASSLQHTRHQRSLL